ncbi:MAG: hypothetical protein U1E25_07600 [Methylocystis sp.]
MVIEELNFGENASFPVGGSNQASRIAASFSRHTRRIFQSIELRGSRFAGSAETSASAAAARSTPTAGISCAADPDCGGSARPSVGVTLDKVEQFLFVRFNILMAREIAEFHVVGEKCHFESIADEREGKR